MHTRLMISAVILLLALTAAFWLSNVPKGIQLDSQKNDLITGAESSYEESIIVLSPQAGEKVTSPFILKGRARVFENKITYILRHENGSEIYKGHVIAKPGDASQSSDFETKVPIPVQASKKIALEVFNYSAKDGSIQNLVSIPLELETVETTDIDIYLTNAEMSLERGCEKVFPVKRQILKTDEKVFMALYQLIQGPNIGELGQGFDTAIPGKTKVNSVITQNETLYVDFDEWLDYGVSELCQITSIKSQIQATLKQFEPIKNAVISINGKMF